MADQDPQDEKNRQPEKLSEITDFSRYGHTDETITSVEKQMLSGNYKGNKDTNKETQKSQAGMNIPMTSRHSQADEHEDDSKQHLETEMKHRAAVSYPEMSRESSEHSQAEGSSGIFNAATKSSQAAEYCTDELPKGGSDFSSFTVVLFGNTSAVHFRDENILLGAEHVALDQAHIARKIKVSGCSLSVVNILDLHEGDLYLDHVDHITKQVVNENNIQAFIFVLKLGQFTDNDKIGLKWLKRTFGEDALSFVMILFTYEREEECDTIVDDLKNNTVLEQLIKTCGDRYCTCSKSMNNQSEMRSLLEKIDHLVSENNQHCYTAENFSTAVHFKEHQRDRGGLKHDCKVQLPRKDEESFSFKKDEHRKIPTPESEDNQPKDAQNQKKVEDTLKDEKTRQLFSRINLDSQHKLKISEFLQITASSLKCHEPCAEKDVVHTFLHRLIMMDYTARYIPLRQQVTKTSIQSKPNESKDVFSVLFGNKAVSSGAVEQFQLHPMDIQMAVFHSADNFLQQLFVTKLSQCQYAVPLLVPSPTTGEIQFPLWTFRQIKKSWMSTDDTGNTTSKCKSIAGVETPMVAFLRLGSVSSSKSQLMNTLINDRYHTFFDRNCPQDSRIRLLMNGVVEIAWYCPSGKNSDWLTDCVAFCNLHGDSEINTIQREIVTKMSTVNVVLISSLGKDESMRTIIEELLQVTKPLIFLITDCDSDREELWKGKYRIGLKDRSQSDVAEELRRTIKDCIKSSTFKLEHVAKQPNIVVDEEKEECQQAKKAATQLMSLFNNEHLPQIKEKHLPCQGKLWHTWCQENKKLYHLMGHLENHKVSITQEMNKIRSQQHKLDFSCLLKCFLENLNTLTEDKRVYFLKWVGMLLDSCTSDCLSTLHHAYDEQWNRVLELKKKHKMSPLLTKQQARLENISKDLNAATFGVEHILREMGQVFEAWTSVQSTEVTNEAKENFASLPQIAAEIILTGYPLELMDGDASHVPLIWVSAVLDELVKVLGDQRVFVLSVLGIQSSGKSTLLNAMFGLQFAVSAGRCTRGAFMQLVRVSEEMKQELKFDYILVVDTEGLRALERAEKTAIHHDNELATFVVGLGNLTLINIFGENPAEMQDILQIVVQAFLRMKKVQLNPSCLFVHQNVEDITAGEKTMEGRRRLQEKLDEMTKLAAVEEDCDAQCFSDIIAFDVQSDVRYFAQLWEGSPPMAPPNPSYSENIDELRKKILSKISTNRGVTLSQFRSSIGDLWNALLNENFVFSFRNTLEITVYRKLEHEYTKWTWSLRSAMLSVENKLLNRVNNEKSLRIEEKDLVAQMAVLKKEVDKEVNQFFRDDYDKNILIQWQERFERKIMDLYNELVKVTKKKLDHVYQQKIAREKVDEEKTRYESKLFKLSTELAFNLKDDQTDENALKNKFDDVWSTWLSELTPDAPMVGDIDVFGDVTKILSETYELPFVCEQQNLGSYKILDVLGDYSDYVFLKKSQEPPPTEQHLTDVDANVDKNEKSGQWHCARNFIGNTYNKVLSAFHQTSAQLEHNSATDMLSGKDNSQLRGLVKDVVQQSKNEIQKMSSAELGYNHSYIQQIIESVKSNVNAHQQKISWYTLKKEFTIDLCLHVCTSAADQFTELHMKFKEANNVRLYLKKQKPQYFNIFKNYYNGATSTTVFGEFIVDKLELSILQAAYNQTAIDVAEKMKRDVPAFSGNRSNLEKHILTSLAEEESFENYTKYLHKPKEHFNHFITKKVNKYLLKDKCQEVLETMKSNIKSKGRCVMDAVNKATEEVNKINGDISMWLDYFSKELKDELQFKEESCVEQKEITDLGFLQEVVNKGLADTMTKLCGEFKSIPDLKQEMFRKKPDEILIEYLCQCCWVQCPFCNAICTNTMEDHDGDHRVRFHRNCGINGWSFVYSENLGVDFCTTAVSSNFYFRMSSGDVFPFKEYRKAGGEYAKWNISPDTSEMPYWKWFVCRFQKELEEHYKRKFTGNGEIPHQWRDITRDRAIQSLKEL